MTEADQTRTLRDLRRSALAQDVLLFCVAFSAGALAYGLFAAVTGTSESFWTIGLSDGLLLSGLVAGELFLLWNNGLRQGVRGHSIGKHRSGLRVVDRDRHVPTGAGRGLLRGLVTVGLLDLALAAVPVGLPTVLRRFTPEEWHVGAAAYVALLLLVVPLLLPGDRGVADVLARTSLVRATGEDALIRPSRRRALVVLDVVGVVGVVSVAALYIAFFWPLLWQLPSLR